MPARISIKQRIPNTVAIPVQRQRVPDISKVAVFCQKAPFHSIIIPCPQVLAVNVRVVALAVEGILVVILRTSECRIPESIVPAGLL